MSAFLLDNFTGTDGTNLTSHTPDLGGSWGLVTGSGGSFAIQSNRAYCSSAGVIANSATPVGGAIADYDVTAQVVPLSVDHNTSWGVIGRTQPGAYTFYLAFIYGFSGNFSLFLSAFVSAGYGNLANVALPTAQPTLGTSHEIKLSMYGTTISVSYDGVTAISLTDSYVTGAGTAGLYLGTSTTTSGVHVDSLTASTPTATPTNQFFSML